jgi:hypothetical protein
MDSVLRAQATDERQVFMKALVAENDDRILGFAIVGAEAGEVLAVVYTAWRAFPIRGLPMPPSRIRRWPRGSARCSRRYRLAPSRPGLGPFLLEPPVR